MSSAKLLLPPQLQKLPPFGWYQIMLPGDRNTHKKYVCSGHGVAERQGVTPVKLATKVIPFLYNNSTVHNTQFISSTV